MKPHIGLTSLVAAAWKRNKTLTLVTILLAIGFVFSAVGAALDPTVITGAPRWLKPTKFAISVAIYTGTLVWLLGELTVWPTLIRRLSTVTGWLLLAEVALIDLQAARGTTSHFNVSTAFDAAVFSTMGIMVLAVWVIGVILFIALCRQRFESRAWGTALRAGVLLTVLGSGTGALMTRPTPPQLVEMKTGAPKVIGGHTVGGADDGAGLPITKWSAEHGDLRIPHFVGLHGMQVLPLFAWLLAVAGWSEQRRWRFVVAVSVSYAALFALVLGQALSGVPAVSSNRATVEGWGVWLMLTTVAFAAAGFGGTVRKRTHTAAVSVIH